MDISKLNGYAIIDVSGLEVRKINAYAITDTNFVMTISKLNAYAILDQPFVPANTGTGNMFMLF